MSKCRGYYVVLLATILAGVPSVSVRSKSVCIGESIPVFENLTFGGLMTDVFLYKTNPNNSHYKRKLIAIWSYPKSDENSGPRDQFKHRLAFDDKGGNIFLKQFRRSDEATYVIMYGVNMNETVEIFALVAPNETCRPKIKHSGDVLYASVESDICGKPPASIQWKDSSGSSSGFYYIDKNTVKLPSGKKAGTYYACLDGPALGCVKNTTKLDYCSNFTMEENFDPPVISETSDQKTTALIVVGIILVVVFIVAVVFIFLYWKMKKSKHLPLQRDTRESPGEVVTYTKHQDGSESIELPESKHIPLQRGTSKSQGIAAKCTKRQGKPTDESESVELQGH